MPCSNNHGLLVLINQDLWRCMQAHIWIGSALLEECAVSSLTDLVRIVSASSLLSNF